MLEAVLTLAEGALAAPTPKLASRAFFGATKALGATYLQTRLYHRPRGPLTPGSHWAAGGFVDRIALPTWEGSGAFNHICFEHVPSLRAVADGRTRYRFGDYAPHDDPLFGKYWDAMSEGGMTELLCATAYGANNKTASIHLGFDRRDFTPDEETVIHIASVTLVEKLMQFDTEAAPVAPVRLTPREYDSIAYVAEGKTDWEIGTILGISETTARTHVDNARRKLGAVNRAHAVARFLADGAAPSGPASARS